MAGNVKREGIIRVVAGLLLAIFSVYYANSTLFSHTHTIDGATITHSHIFGADHADGSDEGHTSQEADLIKHLTLHYALTGEGIYVDDTYVAFQYKIYVAQTLKLFEAEPHRHSAPRAPPQFFV